MAAINGESIKIVPYDTEETDFVTPVKQALGLEDDDALELLHEYFSVGSVVTRANDSKTALHRLYYEGIEDTDFYDEYRSFVKKVVADLIEGPLIVQKIPSFRVHLLGNKAVGGYHRDSDLGHQSGAINFWLPLTDAYSTNSVHIVEDDQSEPAPIDVKYGEVLVFDAVNLLHGNEINTTDHTRVSFDFRVIPERDYVDSDTKSANTMSRLAIGDYYIKLTDL